jgi:hypothetical protein
MQGNSAKHAEVMTCHLFHPLMKALDTLQALPGLRNHSIPEDFA